MMKKFFLTSSCIILFSCTSKSNNQEQNIEKSIFSKEERDIIHTHFKADTNNKTIKAVKIQTH